MTRPVTLCTGQWADLPVAELARKCREMGFDGLELACWGDHFEVDKATQPERLLRKKRELLKQHNMQVFAISGHLVGQAVLDIIDARHKSILPPLRLGQRQSGRGERPGRRGIEEHGPGRAEAGRERGQRLHGLEHLASALFVPAGLAGHDRRRFKLLAERFNPILDVFAECGVKFALEVHPTEIAFDLYTTERALEALDYRPEFGFNFDPSHLIWQGVDPVEFIREFPDRIYHVHMKDAIVNLNGRTGILSSHLNFGDPRRGWDFRSLGRGGVNFEEIIRALNAANYTGPLSVEWEDSGMDREHGAKEALEFVRKLDFEPSKVAFDAAFDKEEQTGIR